MVLWRAARLSAEHRYGVTAINEMTYHPHIDAVVQAYQDAGLRVTFGIGATDIAENDQIRVTPVDECLRQAEELYHKWHGQGTGCARLPCRRDVRPARRS